MDRLGRAFDLVGVQRRLHVPAQSLAAPAVVQVTGADIQLGTALAFAWLGFSSERQEETGYAVAGGSRACGAPGAAVPTAHPGRPPCPAPAAPPMPAAAQAPCDAVRRAYIGPHFRWEVSGFWPTVAEEITLGGAHSLNREAWEMMRALGLEPLLTRDPARLSGGETAKTVLAGHLIARPQRLVLDRVLSELDARSRAAVLGGLRAWLPDGIVLVLDDGLRGRVDLAVNTDGDAARWGPPAEAAAGAAAGEGGGEALSLRPLRLRDAAGAASGSGAALELRGFHAVRPWGAVFAPVDATARAGDLVLVQGPNGSGKSSLLEALAGLLEAQGGLTVTVAGRRVDAAGACAYSPQDPQHDITELGMDAEIGLACGDPAAVPGLLEELGVPAAWRAVPLHEDMGLQKLTSVVAATLRGKPLCLLDEPTIYLAEPLRRVAERAIRRSLGRGTIVVCSTHDAQLVRALAGPAGGR